MSGKFGVFFGRRLFASFRQGIVSPRPKAVGAAAGSSGLLPGALLLLLWGPFSLWGEGAVADSASLSSYFIQQVERDLQGYYSQPPSLERLTAYVSDYSDRYRRQIEAVNPIVGGVQRLSVENAWLPFVGEEVFQLTFKHFYQSVLHRYRSKEEWRQWFRDELMRQSDAVTLSSLFLDERLSDYVKELLVREEGTIDALLSQFASENRFTPHESLYDSVKVQNNGTVHEWQERSRKRLADFREKNEMELECLRRGSRPAEGGDRLPVSSAEALLKEGLQCYAATRDEGIRMGLERFTEGREELERLRTEWEETLFRVCREQQEGLAAFQSESANELQAHLTTLEEDYNGELELQLSIVRSMNEIENENRTQLENAYCILHRLHAAHLHPLSETITAESLGFLSGSEKALAEEALRILESQPDIQAALAQSATAFQGGWLAPADLEAFLSVNSISTDTYIESFFTQELENFDFILSALKETVKQKRRVDYLESFLDSQAKNERFHRQLEYLTQLKALAAMQNRLADNDQCAEADERQLFLEAIALFEAEQKRHRQWLSEYRTESGQNTLRESLTLFKEQAEAWLQAEKEFERYNDLYQCEQTGRAHFQSFLADFRENCSQLKDRIFLNGKREGELSSILLKKLTENHTAKEDPFYTGSAKEAFFKTYQSQLRGKNFSDENLLTWLKSFPKIGSSETKGEPVVPETLSEYAALFFILSKTDAFRMEGGKIVSDNPIEAFLKEDKNREYKNEADFLSQSHYETGKYLLEKINNLYEEIGKEENFHFFYDLMQSKDFSRKFENVGLPYLRKLLVESAVKDYDRLTKLFDQLWISMAALPVVGEVTLAIPLGLVYDQLNRLGQWMDTALDNYVQAEAVLKGNNRLSVITETRYNNLEGQIKKQLRNLNPYAAKRIDIPFFLKSAKSGVPLDYAASLGLKDDLSEADLKSAQAIKSEAVNCLMIFTQMNKDLGGEKPVRNNGQLYAQIDINAYLLAVENGTQRALIRDLGALKSGLSSLKQLGKEETLLAGPLTPEAMKLLNRYASDPPEAGRLADTEALERYQRQSDRTAWLTGLFQTKQQTFAACFETLSGELKNERTAFSDYLKNIGNEAAMSAALKSGHLKKQSGFMPYVREFLKAAAQTGDPAQGFQLNRLLLEHACSEKELFASVRNQRAVDLQAVSARRWETQMAGVVQKGREEWSLRMMELECLQAQWMADVKTTVLDLEGDIRSAAKEGVRYRDVYALIEGGDYVRQLSRAYLNQVDYLIDTVDFPEMPMKPLLLSAPQSGYFREADSPSAHYEASQAQAEQLAALQEKLAQNKLTFERKLTAYQVDELWNQMVQAVQRFDTSIQDQLEGALVRNGFVLNGSDFVRQGITGMTLFRGTIVDRQRIGRYRPFDLAANGHVNPYGGSRFEEAVNANDLAAVLKMQGDDIARQLDEIFGEKPADGDGEGDGEEAAPQPALERTGNYEVICQMTAEEFFDRSKLEAYQKKENGLTVTLNVNSPLLNEMERINQYVLHYEVSQKITQVSGGEMGTHVGWEGRLIPNLTWESLEKELKKDKLPVSIPALKSKAFIRNLEGEGEMGRMWGELALLNLKQSKGIGEMEESFWNLRMWDDEGSLLKAISLKDAVDLTFQVVVAALSLGSLPPWALSLIGKIPDLLFTVADSAAADTPAEAGKKWIDFGINFAADAVSSGIGAGFDRIPGLNSFTQVERFFTDLGESAVKETLHRSIGGLSSGISVEGDRLVWDSRSAINQYFGKETIASVVGSLGGQIVSGGLGLIETDGLKGAELSRLDQTNAFAGAMVGMGLSGALSQQLDLSVLNLADFGIPLDVGLLKLHVGADGSFLKIGSDGVGINGYRLFQAASGLKLYHQMDQINRLKIDHWENKNKDLRSILSLVHSSGEVEVMDRLNAILRGEDRLEWVSDVDYEACTVKEGDHRVTKINRNANEPLLKTLFLHELHRDGVTDTHNQSETARAVFSHIRMVLNSNDNDPAVKEEINQLLEALDANDSNRIQQMLQGYSSTADYWKQVGDHVEFDGKSDLSYEDALNPSGEAKTVIQMDESVSVEQSLVQIVGKEQLEKQLGKKAFSLSKINQGQLQTFLQLSDEDYQTFIHSHLRKGSNRLNLGNDDLSQKAFGFIAMQQFGFQYDNQKNSWETPNGNEPRVKLSDIVKSTLIVSNEKDANNEYKKYYGEMELIRDVRSYNGRLGLIADPGTEENRRLDSLILTIYDDHHRVVSRESFDGVQSVDVYNEFDKNGYNAAGGRGLDREQSTASGLEGNTLVSKNFDLNYQADGESLFHISDAVTLDGDRIDSYGFDGEPGGYTAVHSDDRFGYSDGCFIVWKQDLNRMKETLNQFGWNAGYQNAVLSGTMRHSGLPEPMLQQRFDPWKRGISRHGKELIFPTQEKGKKRIADANGNERTVDWQNMETKLFKPEENPTEALFRGGYYFSRMNERNGAERLDHYLDQWMNQLNLESFGN